MNRNYTKGWWLSLALDPMPVYRQVEVVARSSSAAPIYVAEIPDDDALEYTPDGMLKPFVVLYFGGPIRSAGDHSLVSSRNDTTILYFTVECYAGREWDAVSLKGHFLDVLCGLTGDDFSELILNGSMSYSRSSNKVRPTMYVETFALTCRSNLSS